MTRSQKGLAAVLLVVLILLGAGRAVATTSREATATSVYGYRHHPGTGHQAKPGQLGTGMEHARAGDASTQRVRTSPARRRTTSGSGRARLHVLRCHGDGGCPGLDAGLRHQRRGLRGEADRELDRRQVADSWSPWRTTESGATDPAHPATSRPAERMFPQTGRYSIGGAEGAIPFGDVRDDDPVVKSATSTVRNVRLDPLTRTSSPRQRQADFSRRSRLASFSRGTRVGSTVLDDLAGDDDLGDVLAAGDVVHDVEQHLFEDRAQAAGAGAAQQREVGDRLDGVRGELQLDAVELEQLVELLDQRVARLDQDPDQRVAVERG